MTTPESKHIPVLLTEVIDALKVKAGGIYVDATFGLGGYSRAILQKTECTVYGIDRDPAAQEVAAALAGEFSGRFHFIQGCFGEMRDLLAKAGVQSVHGIAFDLGVSSIQLDQPDRGFSFRYDGPLDMRMGQQGPSAADLVNTLPEEELADMFYELGEERFSRKVARCIVHDRKETPFTRTAQLAELVRRVVPFQKSGLDPATRVFQALRIQVNGELTELTQGLEAAAELLKEEGRLAVVSFHSLEDRLVKQFLAIRGGGTQGQSRHLPVQQTDATGPQIFKILSKRVIKPSENEIRVNSRARSARLRVAEKMASFPPQERRVP